MQHATFEVISCLKINLKKLVLKYYKYRCQKTVRLLAFYNVSFFASVVLPCTKLIIFLIVIDNQNISLYEQRLMRKIQFKVTEAFKNSTKEKFALAMSINSVQCSFSYCRLLFVKSSRLNNLCKKIVNLYISNRLTQMRFT